MRVAGSGSSDTNGGGFVIGSGGTDYSQQDSPQLTVSDGSCSGTTTLTSATGGFTSAMVGNVLYLSSGPGWYQITAYTDTNTVTIDRAGPSASGMTVNVGGALATLAKCAALFVGSNRVYVKGTGFTSTATTTFSASVTPGGSVPYNKIIGYGTTRGDQVKAKLTLSTNTGLTGISLTGTGWIVENMEVDCSDLGTSTGISCTTNFSHIYNCKVSQFTTNGIVYTGTASFVGRCEVTDGTGTSGITARRVFECNVHDNTCTGVVISSEQLCINSIITNNTGASSDGVSCSFGSSVIGCTIHGNGRHGINCNSGNGIIGQFYKNNSISGNGGYGTLFTSSGSNPAEPWVDGNAYGYPANTSGARGNGDSTSGIYAEAPYTNVWDVSVTTGTQYDDAANDDFDLNNTANQGALLRDAGQPETWPGNSAMESHIDIGASQHVDPAGGSGGLITHPGLNGGLNG